MTHFTKYRLQNTNCKMQNANRKRQIAKGKSQILPFAFCLLSITLFWSACGNKKADRGDTVVVRIADDPDKLNPLTTENAQSVMILNQMFCTLLNYDANTLELNPFLAESLPVISNIDTGANKGGVSYTFVIRPEAVWDNGSPVTANDVVFTVKAVLNKLSGANSLLSGLDFLRDIKIDATNPKKFTVIANKKYILSESKIGTLPIIPAYAYDAGNLMSAFTIPELVKLSTDTSKTLTTTLTQFAQSFQNPKFSNDKTAISGCGAYALAEKETGQRVVIERKKNWWGEKLATTLPRFQAKPARILFKVVKDEAATLALLKNDEIDVVAKINPRTFSALKANDTLTKNYNFYNAPTLTLVQMGMNCKSEKLNDARVRRALAYCTNSATYIKSLMNGYATPASNPFVVQRKYYASDIPPFATNIVEAKKLLTDAGWRDSNADSTVDKKINGKSTELVLHFPFAAQNAVAKNIGLMLKESAKQAGIKIELEAIESKVLTERYAKRDYDVFVTSSTFEPALDDPKELWASSSNTPSGGNRYQFENKTADALIEQIRGELDTEKRNVLYKKFQDLFHSEAPAIFLFSPQERLMIHKRLQNAQSVVVFPGFEVNTLAPK